MTVDVTDDTFGSEVIERSKELPVVVDFWADWCGPCKALGPVLDKAATAREGKVVLAKLDTEANPRQAQAFGIRSIPAVKAFKDGEVVDEFVGVLPPVQVERFFDKLVPSDAEQLAAAGDEESLRRAVELDPREATAALPLARLLLARGDHQEADEVLEPIVGSFPAEGMRARVRLTRTGEPDLSEAFNDLDEERYEQALDRLIEAIPNADGAKDDIRAIVVGALDDLGVASPVAREYRRKLATALY